MGGEHALRRATAGAQELAQPDDVGAVERRPPALQTLEQRPQRLLLVRHQGAVEQQALALGETATPSIELAGVGRRSEAQRAFAAEVGRRELGEQAQQARELERAQRWLGSESGCGHGLG